MAVAYKVDDIDLGGFQYYVGSRWFDRVESPAVIGDHFVRTLDLFKKIDPTLEDWGIGDNIRQVGIPLETARKSIAALVENNVRDDDDGPDERLGYHLFAVNSPDEDPAGSPTTMTFMVNAGSLWRNEARFEVGDVRDRPDPAVVTYPLFKAVMLTMIAMWPCQWANACAFRSRYEELSAAPGAPPMPYSAFHLSWMAYLPASISADLVPPSGVVSERTPDGGLLLIAVEERLDPTNADHMRRSRILVDFMEAHTAGLPG